MKTSEETINFLIDQEAKRIMQILLNMHKKSIKVNKPFYKLVKEIMKKEYTFLYKEVLSETTKYIPLNLIISPMKGKIFITVHEFENNISKHEIYEQLLTEDIANKIIQQYKNNKLRNQNILQLFEQSLPKRNISHLKQEIVVGIIDNALLNISKNYKIISLNPFIIEDLNN